MDGSPSAIITMGLGSWGSVNLMVTLGYGTSAVVVLDIDNRDASGISNATRSVVGISNTTRSMAGVSNSTRSLGGRLPN